MQNILTKFLIASKKGTENPEESLVVDEAEKKIEQKIKKWFTADEKKSNAIIIGEQGGIPRKILTLTDHRAILFESGWLWGLKDKSDKVWRQFISVHLKEGTFYSALDLHFFCYHDSLYYHNPYKDNSPYKDENNFMMTSWHLERLNKGAATAVYAFLKDKELHWKEKRRKEQLEQLGVLNAKPPKK